MSEITTIIKNKELTISQGQIQPYSCYISCGCSTLQAQLKTCKAGLNGYLVSWPLFFIRDAVVLWQSDPQILDLIFHNISNITSPFPVFVRNLFYFFFVCILSFVTECTEYVKLCFIKMIFYSYHCRLLNPLWFWN